MAKFSFDTSTVEVSGSGSAMPPIPDGTYHALVMGSEIKVTKPDSPTPGQMIVLEWHIVGGHYDGRRFWQNYNIVNANDTTQKRAKAEMSSAIQAMGLTRYEDTDELHMHEIKITVSTEPGSNGYGPKNRIDAYAPAYEKPAQPAQASQPAEASEPSEPSEPAEPAEPAEPQKPVGKKPPWEK